MSKEINCPYQNGESRPVYKKLELGQLCDIAVCSSSSDCDKAKHGGGK